MAGTALLAVATVVPSVIVGAFGNTLYVASGGTDTGNCQVQASPCATITYALGQASQGDLIDILSHPATEPLTINQDITFHLPTHTLPDPVTINAGTALSLQEDAGAVLSGNIIGDGALTENDPNGFDLSLQGTNTYAGGTNVLSGSLVQAAPAALPTGTRAFVNTNAILDLGGNPAELSQLSGDGTVDATGTTLTVDSTGISRFTGTIDGGRVILPNGPALLVTQQPTDQDATPGGSATFSVSTVSANGTAFDVKWLASTDAGTTFSNLSDGPGVSGSNTSTLTISGVTAAQSGTEYRAELLLVGGGGLPYLTNPAALWVSAGSPAPAPSPPPAAPFARPPVNEPPGTYTLALNFQPGSGNACGPTPPYGPATPPAGDQPGEICSFTDPATGVTYSVDGTNAIDKANVTVSGYEVNTAAFPAPPVAGDTYVAGFAVAFSPANLGGGSLSLTITDPAIQAGAIAYQVIPVQQEFLARLPVSVPALDQVTSTATAGTITIPNITTDPVFLVAQPPAPPAPPAPPIVVGGGGGGTTVSPGAPRKLIRLGGVDRIATAAVISQYDFPQAGSAQAVVLGRDDLFADDLAGSPFAHAVNGPLLLTDPAYLDNRTAAEIARVLPPGGTVYLLGQTSALSLAVEKAVAAAGFNPVRVGGPDRYGTALDIADQLHDPGTIFEADGTHPGGAVSAAPASILSTGAILLTAGSTQSAPTAGYIQSHAPGTRYSVGAAAASADPAGTALAGPDDDATSVAVAQQFFPNPTVVGIATDGAFPDALTGAATSEAGAGPTLLVPPAGPLPAEVAAYLAAHPSITTIIVYGGTAAVSEAVANAALAATPPTG
ncbi:MAG TPA: cell wall-binding repeat-containing protein [Acidimicrobiales bacterium]|nr:cell wall-binding repeat-containing protein [Acidimicrobiales bacterium]